ncbi:MAG: hypothetical protein Q4B71_06925 [Cardiobacteriaceae bacterium]|nr:hypothetical protein [Cardiobacteriaceae bacterium]
MTYSIVRRLFIITSLMVSLAEAKKVVLYVDHATSPTMQQLMHFAEHAHEKETAFAFAFNRIQLEPELLSALPEIFIAPAKQEIPFNDYLLSLLPKYPEGLELELHSNLHLSYTNIKPLIPLMLENKNIKLNHLYLYDDGSIEYESFEKIRDKDIANHLEKQYKIFSDFVHQNIDPQTQTTEYDYLLRHVYPAFFPTTYYYLRPDYVEKEAFLQPLRDFYKKHQATIATPNPKRFSEMSQEQQNFYLKLIKTERSILNDFTDQQPNYVFIGTNENAWNNPNVEKAAQYQANLLKHYVDPKGQFYVGEGVKVFYKGHPAAKELNKMVMEKVPNVTEIPAHISFGTLLMLNADIDRVMGMQSTIFLGLPPEQIGELFFTDKQGEKREDIFEAPLVKIFKKLNNLKDEQIQKVEDLPLLD